MGRVARVGEERNAYEIRLENLKGRDLLDGIIADRDNSKVGLHKSCECVFGFNWLSGCLL